MTIPTKIYLQIVDECGNALDPMIDEVTWSWDKINDSDVAYEIVQTQSRLCKNGHRNYAQDAHFCLWCDEPLVGHYHRDVK